VFLEVWYVKTLKKESQPLQLQGSVQKSSMLENVIIPKYVRVQWITPFLLAKITGM